MGYNESCKKSHEREKLEISSRGEEDKASFDSELEEGEFRKDGPFGLEKHIHKGMVASVMKLGSSAKGRVNTWQSTSPERGSHQGDTANTTVMHSKCSSMEDQLVNVTQSTCHRIYSEKKRQSYSPSFHFRSKERHEQRTRKCFSYHDYCHVLKKIEKVCSERLSKQLLHQNKDRKEFNTLIKEEELKFFKEHAWSYRIHYERVIPTARYHRMKLPKLPFCVLRKVFCKYMRSQLIKFVRRQINDRNKEKRMKERWIFEATAGYLNKNFDETSLTCSGFEMEKFKCHVHAYFEGEQEPKFLDMQSLTTEIGAIASSRELEETVTDKDSDIFQPEPIIENLQSPIETNGGAEDGLSVGAGEEIGSGDNMSSHFNNSSTMEFNEEAGMQADVSSPPKNEGGYVERSSCSRPVADKTLALSKASEIETIASSKELEETVTDKDSDIFLPEPIIEKLQSPIETNGGAEDELPVDAAEEIDLVHSMSSHFNNAPTMEFSEKVGTKVAVSSPSQNEGTKKQRCMNPGDDASEGSCFRSQRNMPHESDSNIHETALHLEEEPQAERLPLHNVAGNKEVSSGVTSSFGQISEQRNTTATSSTLAQVTEQQFASNSSLLTPCARQQYDDQTSQTVALQYQPSCRNNFSAQAWLDSPRSSNVQQQSNNQTTIGSTSGQYMLESGIQSDPLTIEMSRLLMLHHLMTKKHLSERQKIMLECEKEMAECKRKFDEQFYNLEMETQQKRKDIEILQDKICKQHILAETFQFLRKASGGVASYSQTGAPRRTTGEANEPSWQHELQFPASVTMYQSPQPAVQPSTNNFLRQPFMATPQAIANTLGRSATNLTHAPTGVMGTGISYHAPQPHLRAFVNQLPPRGAAASYDR